MFELIAENTNCTSVSLSSSKNLDRGEHVVLGISPFNSYFTAQTIYNSIIWAYNNFKEINIFIPDRLPVHTFLACGYSLDQAEKKVRRQTNYLINKIDKALQLIANEKPKLQKSLILIDDLDINEEYGNVLFEIYEKYKKDACFKNFCLEATKSVTSENKGFIMNLDIAVNYFLRELPLLVNSPNIFNVNYSTFVYHKYPPLLKKFYNDNAFGLIANNQGFCCVEFC